MSTLFDPLTDKQQLRLTNCGRRFFLPNPELGTLVERFMSCGLFRHCPTCLQARITAFTLRENEIFLLCEEVHEVLVRPGLELDRIRRRFQSYWARPFTLPTGEVLVHVLIETTDSIGRPVTESSLPPEVLALTPAGHKVSGKLMLTKNKKPDGVPVVIDTFTTAADEATYLSAFREVYATTDLHPTTVSEAQQACNTLAAVLILNLQARGVADIQYLRTTVFIRETRLDWQRNPFYLAALDRQITLLQKKKLKLTA